MVAALPLPPAHLHVSYTEGLDNISCIVRSKTLTSALSLVDHITTGK